MSHKVEVVRVDGITVGRRITEILDEKGKAFTVSAFSVRVGVKEMTLHRIIKGERSATLAELQDIAAGLKLTVDRIKQTDHEKRSLEISQLKKTNPKRAIQLVLEILPCVVGYTERFGLLNDLGSAHYHLKQYEDAQRVFEEALLLGEKIKQKYKDTERLYKITRNLMVLYTVRKDSLALIQLLNRTGTAFAESNPERAGTLSYSYAMCAYNMGSYEQYRIKMYESLGHFQRSGNDRAIALATHNVAYSEYKNGNYLESQRLFESILGRPRFSLEDNLIANKDYVKTLLKLGETERADKMIRSSLDQLNESELHDLRAKFLLLNAHMTGNLHSAEQVLMHNGISKKLSYLACKFLMEHCAKTGDLTGMMNYYNAAEQYSSTLLSSWEEIE